jgi:uracil-DNA glycosylase
MTNMVLTVRAGDANSHKKKGWEHFTNAIIQQLNQKERPIVFILWGNNAQKVEKHITADHHLIIKSYHPSPLSANRGFFGTKPFSRTNEFLKQHDLTPIDWQIENSAIE